MQIIVLGMHRSGTSAVARLLNLMGAYFGGENISTGASAENEKGFWERLDVRSLNDSMLHNANCDWDRIAELDLNAIPDDFQNAYHRSARDIILNLDAHRPWFIKEPRLCILLPLWRPALELPFCVHVFRHPVEVAHSLRARNGIPIKAGLALWEAYNAKAVESSADLPRFFLSYSQLLSSPQPVVNQLREAMSSSSGYEFRTPPAAELAGALDSSLRHQRYENAGGEGFLSKSQLTLYELLTDAPGNGAFAAPPVSRSSLNTLRRFESSGEHLAARMRRSNARQRASDTDPRLALKSMELDQALKAVHEKSDAASDAARTNAKLTEALNKQNTELALKNDAIKRLMADVDNMRNVLAKRDTELAGAQTALATKDDALVNLKVELADAQATSTAKDGSLAQLQDEIADLRAASATTNESLVQLQAEFAGVQSAAAAKDDLLARLQAELAGAQAAATAYGDSQARLRTENAEMKAQLTTKDDAMARMATESADYKTELAARVETAERLSAQVREYETRTAINDQAIERLTANAKERQQEISSLEHTVRRLTEESRHLRSELDAKTQSLAASSVTATRLTDELSQLRNRTEQAVKRITDESVKIADENRDLKRRGDLEAANAARLRAEADALRGRHQDLTAAVDAILRSRRWRVGNFLLSLRYRLLFRRVPPMATDTIKRIAEIKNGP